MRIRARYETLFLICLWATALMNAGASGAIELKGGTLGPDGKTIWHDAQQLGIEGKGWEDTESTYDRLPRKAKGVVPQRVWNYGRFPAGLSVRFATDAETVRVRWTLSDEKHNFEHISDIATSGIDLYYRNERSGKFRYTHADFRTFTPKKRVNTTSFDLPQSEEYELNLPTYRILDRLEIGVPQGKTLAKFPPRDLSTGIVFYGTSITQGGNASRPGLSAVTMVRRKLDVPVVNLGICGNGKMEIEMAELIAELDPAVYVVDCLWNMNMRHVSERVEPFIRKLRETRPTTPLILAEDSHYDDLPTEKGDIVRKIVEKLIAEGDKNLYFLPNKGMLGDDGDGVVEDRHPNDLGLYRQAEVFITLLKPLLAKQSAGNNGDAPAGPVSLRCEYLENPTGVDVLQPRLSWKLKSDIRGQKQTAYRVLVASSRELLDQHIGDLWDSGKVKSDQSVHVAYAGPSTGLRTGKPLDSKMPCFWKVMVWDKDGKASGWSEIAHWRMGLLNPSDWKAEWIGAPLTPAAPTTPAGNNELIVKKATLRTSDNKVSKDVTAVMQKVLKNRSPYRVNFGIFGGDPAPRVNKELVVEYVADGKPGTEKGAGAKRIDLFKGRKKIFPPSQAPLFRKEFDLAAAPDSAIVTVHSPGYFEVYINGEKVGTDVLSPAVSKLDAQTFYVSYDVARYLRPGKNCLGLWLGKGWADNLAVRAQLDAIVAGKSVTIGTDTSWQTRNSGLVRIGGWEWGDFGGERLDARELVPDWNQPGLNTDSWSAALPAKPPAGPVRSHPCPLNRIGETIPAVAVTPLEGGKYEIDFGVALTGWLRMKMPELASGTVVTMTFADIRPEENLYDKRKGRKPEYQHFQQVSEFISAGKPDEVFQHKFNFAAFRYVIVEGLPSAPAKEDATAYLVDSDLEDAGSFECSNDLFNNIHRVNKWTQRCLNLGGFYVDCPHRERMGYGDGQVATEGFMSNFRADRYYRKWLSDWRFVQGHDGNLKHSAPFGKGSGGPGWGGALSAITWRHYLYYGDPRVLEENYDAIRRYVDSIETQCKEGVLRKYGRFIGDWVPPGRGMDSRNHPSTEAAEVFNNGYRLNQIELLTKMADVLGKTDDAERYRKLLAEVRPKVHAAFYDAGKQEYVIDEQAYYVMPLMTGITPEDLRPTLLKKLEENILVKKDGHLDTGMLGTYFMMEYLREIGLNDLVFTMFNQTTYPSWGYMLEQGATTLWEQWNGYWSRVHSCFTSPDNWFYQGLGGIQADPDAPGFKNVIIKPAIVGDLTWVKTHHDTPYGRIVSNWQREDDGLTMEVTIPANSTATVYVPAGSTSDVTVNGKALAEADHVKLLGMENETALIKVGSGCYVITSDEVERSTLDRESEGFGE